MPPGCARATQFGGEPHYKGAASRFGKGLSRETLKDMFAAAPSWFDTIERSPTPTGGTCVRPRASRLSERHICND